MSSVSYRDQTGTAAEAYQRYFVPAIATPISTGLLRAAGLQPGERVADVACGTGIIARLAAAQVAPSGSVTAVDISPDMIDVAQRTPAAAGVPIDWRVADAAELPLDDESCDVVLCQMGLMFMEDKHRALGEMRRVLTAGGRLVLNTPGRIQPPFELMEQAIIKHIHPDLGGFVRAVFSMHDPEAVATLVREAGFSEATGVEEIATLDLPSPAEFLWQYINLTPMSGIVEQAPEAAKQAMEREVVEGWQPFVTDGRVRGEQPVVLVTART